MTSQYTLNKGDKAYVPNGSYLKVCTYHKNIGAFYVSYNYAMRKAYDLAGEAMLTIGKILTEVQDENIVFIRQSVMAKDFGISRVTFARHFNRARELGLIEPDPREGNAQRNIHLWRICPFLVWHGTREELNKYIAALPEDHVWLTNWKG